MSGAHPQALVAGPDGFGTTSRAGLPRLFFVAICLDVGGAERHLASLLPELVRRGWPVTIFCMNRLGAYTETVRAAGVEVIGPPIERKPGVQSKPKRFYAMTKAGLRLFSAMRRRRPAIVHFFLPEPYLVGAPMALWQGVPIRIMSRRGLNLYQRNWKGAASMERSLHPRMSAILANSRRVVADLETEGCEAGQIGVIYNGVALPGLERPIDRVAVRLRLGIPQGALVLIVVANLIEYKGYGDLLQALARVRDRLPADLRLLCVGRDEGALAGLTALRDRLDLSDAVAFLGMRDDVRELLGAADISILPSHEEGFSNAVIEAMAVGLPLIVTDVGGNPEAVAEGVTGLVVPPRSPEDLGEAIVRLANDADMRARFGEAGRVRARERFTLPACVDRYERVYKGLLAGSKMADIDLD